MTPEQFEREKIYRIILSIAKTMLKKDLISEREYKEIEGMMLKKYRPLLGLIGLNPGVHM